MTGREDKIRQIVAELDVQVAEVEANIAVLKALLVQDEVPGDEDPS
jgi:cell division protein ZapA (FtsZ GTPase activity inhibitor)